MTSSLMGAAGAEHSSRERFREFERLLSSRHPPAAHPFRPLCALLSAVEASAQDCSRSFSSADSSRAVVDASLCFSWITESFN